jgi:FtsH-binding integral membrane protein
MLAVLVSSNYAEFARFQHQNTWLAYVNIAITIGTAIALSIVSTNSGVAGLSRTTPINYILLAIFTLAESYLVSFICTLYETESVLMCGALTVAVTAGLTVHALTTKKDYRSNFGTLPH